LIWIGGETEFDLSQVPSAERDAIYYVELMLSPTSVWSIDFSHMLSGLFGLGLAGSTSLFFSVFSGHGYGMGRIGNFGRGGNDRNGSAGMLVMGILISVGVAKTFYSMYKWYASLIVIF
jgi:hypothetical protein